MLTLVLTLVAFLITMCFVCAFFYFLIVELLNISGRVLHALDLVIDELKEKFEV